MSRQFTATALADFPIVQVGDDVDAIILERLQANGITLEDGDVLVVAHKVISKAEGRLVNLSTVVPSDEAKRLAEITGKDPAYLEVVLQDSNEVLRTRRGVIVTEQIQGWVAANAAIDRSNVPMSDGDEWLALLPEDADASARRLRAYLDEETGADVAVIINDTHGRPFRLGAIGVAIGVAGLMPLQDLRGAHDLFGYEMQTTEIATADEIASAASLLQGQTDQGRPVVHMRGVPFVRNSDATATALIRPRDIDMFR